ncbi:MAG: response regulator [bacterium]
MDIQRICLLLVEDDDNEARLVRDMLREAVGVSYEIWHVNSIHDAADSLREKKFDAILCDLTLPDSDNLATFLKVKQSAPDIPVIVMTGFDDHALALAALQRGAQDFLVKGYVDRRLLDSSIRYAIERHRLGHRLERVNTTVLEAERNRVVQETAGGAAHLISQPLTVISVVTDHLLHELSPTDPNYDLLLSLKTAGDRIDKIVKDMQHAKTYATRPYNDSFRIVDLPASARNARAEGDRMP